VGSIAIIGLGLIGGSIGLALKQAGLQNTRIVGMARTPDTRRQAKKLGAIDDDAAFAADAVRDASLVIVAAPILAVRGIFEEIAPALAEGAVVTDAASVKRPIADAARELLPPHAHYIGGHPMAGKEQTGVDAADADLFRDKPWVVAPSVDAPESAVNTVVGLTQACGANAIFMDPAEHDSYVAAISHLPLALSSSLFSVVFGSAAWPELAQLASSGFRDTTRLASGSPEMAHDIMLTNRENVVHWLDRMQQALYDLRNVIDRGDSEEIAEAFSRPQIERDNFVLNGPPRRIEGEEIPKISLGEMLMGSKVAEMLRRQEALIRDAESRAKDKRR
jgi:prephenate dehydrogenase